VLRSRITFMRLRIRKGKIMRLRLRLPLPYLTLELKNLNILMLLRLLQEKLCDSLRLRPLLLFRNIDFGSLGCIFCKTNTFRPFILYLKLFQNIERSKIKIKTTDETNGIPIFTRKAKNKKIKFQHLNFWQACPEISKQATY
jgi:hypothetical protein